MCSDSTHGVAVTFAESSCAMPTCAKQLSPAPASTPQTYRKSFLRCSPSRLLLFGGSTDADELHCGDSQRGVISLGGARGCDSDLGELRSGRLATRESPRRRFDCCCAWEGGSSWRTHVFRRVGSLRPIGSQPLGL